MRLPILREGSRYGSCGVSPAAVDALAQQGVRYVPGFGHRFHPIDPRAPRLLALVDEMTARGAVQGHYAAIARALEKALETRKGKTLR